MALGVLLFAVAAGALAVGIARQSSKPGVDQAVATPVAQAERVTVYYFHGTIRCKTCVAIEMETERVLRERFSDELERGTLNYVAVDYDTPENQHFRTDYDLAFGSVVVQGSGDEGPWENLADVWTLIHSDQVTFDAYLVDHIAPLLPENG